MRCLVAVTRSCPLDVVSKGRPSSSVTRRTAGVSKEPEGPCWSYGFLVDGSGQSAGAILGAFEVLIVIVEALLIRSASRGRFFSRHLRFQPLSLRQTLVVSLAGDLVSIGVSVAVVVTLPLVLR